MPGIQRVRRGKHFAYRLPNGQWLKDRATLERIRRLAIPPAYTDVWICPLPNGHLQATGRDARGRKQYRYHPDWRQARDVNKFERMLEFGYALPRIRERVAQDLAQRMGDTPPREAILATLVRLLDTTLVRIGNEAYARDNGSFGLTTLRNRHAAVEGKTLKLRFKGKSGVLHQVELHDPKVSRIVQRCQSMPGQALFQWEDDDGELHPIGSSDVNNYLREACGADFTAKDFRTWHATVHALALLCDKPEGCGDNPQRPSAKQVLTEVAARLRNTVAVCRKSYVHPRVLEASADLLDELAKPCTRRSHPSDNPHGLSPAEQRLLDFFKRVDAFEAAVRASAT
ncbi:MAG: DNA topoisomerase IB [Rubrivivax sp.]|nr:MAG: DNA topoisomerase IB [Rubrivivax sp.]